VLSVFLLEAMAMHCYDLQTNFTDILDHPVVNLMMVHLKVVYREQTRILASFRVCLTRTMFRMRWAPFYFLSFLSLSVFIQALAVAIPISPSTSTGFTIAYEVPELLTS
jgi:hypothetical protein